MYFARPEFLWLIALAPPLAMALAWYAYKRDARFTKNYGEWRLISRFSALMAPLRYIVKGLALALALASLSLALARPTEQNARMEYPVGTVDVVAIVDVSRSMAAPHYKGLLHGAGFEDGTRLDMARYLIENDIIASLGYNQLGVVAFSGTAFPKAFLTDDLPSLRWQMRRSLMIGSVPGEGSQLAASLQLAATLFDLDSPPMHRRVVVLFSDGGNDSDDAKTIAAMKELKKRNIDLIVAGVGSREAHPIPIKLLSPNDRDQFRYDEFYTVDGVVARTALDEPMLIAVKNAIGGRYVRVDSPSDFHMGSLIAGVDVKYIKGERELFQYPLYGALFFALIALIAPREYGGQSLWQRRGVSRRRKVAPQDVEGSRR